MKVRWHWAYLVLLLLMTQTSVTENINIDPSNTISLSNSQSSQLETTKDQLDVRENISSIDSLDDIVVKMEEVSNQSVNYQKKVRKTKKFMPKSSSSSSAKQTNTEKDRSKTKKKKKGKKNIDEANAVHSRKKRMLWITDDGRLALPPGTSLTISPTIALPFVRYPPDGFLANISVSLPVTIDFDKLGLTDNQNPLGVLPPVLARSMGRAAGSMLANYIGHFLRSRQKRSFDNHDNFKFTTNRIDDDMDSTEIPKLPDEHKHAFHGGERALLYAVIEDFIANFGVNGKACMLRTICEVHSKSIHHFGLIGEMVKLFFTASLSPFSDLLTEYVLAENIGKGIKGPGECFPYYKKCPKSLFKSRDVHKKYEKPPQTDDELDTVDLKPEDDDMDNEIYDINSSNYSM